MKLYGMTHGNVESCFTWTNRRAGLCSTHEFSQQFDSTLTQMSQFESSRLQFVTCWVESELSQHQNFETWVESELSRANWRLSQSWVMNATCVNVESADSIFQDKDQGFQKLIQCIVWSNGPMQWSNSQEICTSMCLSVVSCHSIQMNKTKSKKQGKPTAKSDIDVVCVWISHIPFPDMSNLIGT